MKAIADPRNPERILYRQSHLLWCGILLFMMHLGSRRQFRYERRSEVFLENLNALDPGSEAESVADPDTLAYYARRVPCASLEEFLAYLSIRLIRMKALDGFRLKGFFPVAIDGTQICTFDQQPWEGCPHRTLSNGSIQFFSYVLDAKLLTPSGLALTLANEMLTNEGNEQFDKQDCEQKAFPRLAAKLRALFPRTPICLLLDSLYANQNVIRLCEANRWKYIITFKSGSMPERYTEAEALVRLQPRNCLRFQNPKAQLTQQFDWVDSLPIAEFNPSVLWCTQQDQTGEATRFCWLTNFQVSRSNVENIANKGGRLRWKIENEGYNVQKNNGYEMEHPYCEHLNAFRVFYLLLLIGYYFSQLILQGSLIDSLLETFGSAKNFARRLAESLRNHQLPQPLPMPGQIRFKPP